MKNIVFVHLDENGDLTKETTVDKHHAKTVWKGGYIKVDKVKQGCPSTFKKKLKNGVPQVDNLALEEQIERKTQRQSDEARRNNGEKIQQLIHKAKKTIDPEISEASYTSLERRIVFGIGENLSKKDLEEYLKGKTA